MKVKERLEWVEGWGMAVGGAGYVFRPTEPGGGAEALDTAREKQLPIALRGSGCSYGDAAFRPESVVLDLSDLSRVLSWDPETGAVDVEPGVSLAALWRMVIGDGWWPPVVTGTMEPTVGGMLAMNVHGKNNWHRGTLGEHCTEFDLVMANGDSRTVSCEKDADLFHDVIGSFGQLGIITRARLQMKKVHSGNLEVRAVSAPDLEAMLSLTDDAKDKWEYVVGWIDTFAGGHNLGRGLLHFARHLDLGEDAEPMASLDAEAQDLPANLFGVVPKSLMWRFLKPMTNRPGMRFINFGKYLAGSTVGDEKTYRQGLAAFSFLLDYVPNWKNIYLPGGLIQHQSFVPAASAHQVFRDQLEICHEHGMPSFLAVLKRHRPDTFLMSHAVDGYSLALDFPVVRGRRDRLWAMVRALAEPVVAAGGRFYPAKDAALPGELYRSTFRDGQLERFAKIKAQLDPARILRSGLADRLIYDD
jgi:decaprenylphospho-beta-D-ribofuranose 2-oxidase